MGRALANLRRGNNRAQQHRELSRYYKLNSILGNTWSLFFAVIGGRKTGKSYSVTDFLCGQKKKLGDNCKNYWMRISERSTTALLTNKANKLVDPDLYRKYNLDLTTKGMDVFDHGKPFMTVVPLSSFAKLKGVGFFDKDYEGWYNIVLDEFQLEEGEKRTSFDILYNFIGMCENIVRTTKSHLRVFLLGNTVQEATTILKAFNFLPEKFGRFYLKKKRCVIDNLEPTEEYLKDREGSIADILGGGDLSNYTNEMTKDVKSLYHGKIKKPTAIIKFTKEKDHWYTLWDGFIVRPYKGEHFREGTNFAMMPYLGEIYSSERRQTIFDMYDARALKFASLIVNAYFVDDMKRIRKT